MVVGVVPVGSGVVLGDDVHPVVECGSWFGLAEDVVDVRINMKPVGMNVRRVDVTVLVSANLFAGNSCTYETMLTL